MAHHIIVAGAPMGGQEDRYVSPREEFMQKFRQERAEVRRMRATGECTGEDKPRCYESCPHSAYCSEWQYTVRTMY